MPWSKEDRTTTIVNTDRRNRIYFTTNTKNFSQQCRTNAANRHRFTTFATNVARISSTLDSDWTSCVFGAHFACVRHQCSVLSVHMQMHANEAARSEMGTAPPISFVAWWFADIANYLYRSIWNDLENAEWTRAHVTWLLNSSIRFVWLSILTFSQIQISFIRMLRKKRTLHKITHVWSGEWQDMTVRLIDFVHKHQRALMYVGHKCWRRWMKCA